MTCIHPLSIQVCLLPTISLPHHLLYYQSGQTSAIGSTPSTPRLISGLVFFSTYQRSHIRRPRTVRLHRKTTSQHPQNPKTLLHVNLSLKSPLEFRHFLTRMYPTALINSSHQYKNALCVNLRAPVFQYKYYRSFPEA